MRVNLRQGYADTEFGDDASREAYEAECERARDLQRDAGIRYAVAPRQMVTTPKGKLLPAGTPVSVNDFIGDEERTAYSIFDRLYRRGVILEADVDDGPTAA